jgi:small subunit ribosomal protein S1
MIHVGDLVHEKRINHPQDVLKVGQVVRAQVLENDREKRRLRLGLKQLQPTALDEYIAEHKAGDSVTGRVADVKGNRVTVDLGEGVQAHFSLAAAEPRQEAKSATQVDVSALSSMLSSKWKGGQGGSAPADADPGPKRDLPKAGQVRGFRITKLDADKKKIEIELAS